MRKIDLLYPEYYDMSPDELTAAAALKLHFQLAIKTEVLRELERVITPRVIKLMTNSLNKLQAKPIHSDIDAVELAMLIDKAVEQSVRIMEDNPSVESKTATAVMKKLLSVRGQNMVHTMSVGFMEYLIDCYRAFKY